MPTLATPLFAWLQTTSCESGSVSQNKELFMPAEAESPSGAVDVAATYTPRWLSPVPAIVTPSKLTFCVAVDALVLEAKTPYALSTAPMLISESRSTIDPVSIDSDSTKLEK